jgi:hypothetical protein
MVYSLLPNRTIRTRYVKESIDGTTTSSFTIIAYTAPTAVLATCKAIKKEATDVIFKTVRQLLPGPDSLELNPFITGITPRIESDPTSLLILGARKGPIKATLKWYSCLQTSQYADFEASLPGCWYDMYSLLAKHGYAMEDGTRGEGVRTLVNLVRKSGCILRIRRNSSWLSNSLSHTFHITLTTGGDTHTDTRTAVDQFGKRIGQLQLTYDFYVKIHSLRTVSSRQWRAVRQGIDSAAQRHRDQNGDSDSALVLGISGLDEKFKEAYDRFWRGGEWKL